MGRLWSSLCVVATDVSDISVDRARVHAVLHEICRLTREASNSARSRADARIQEADERITRAYALKARWDRKFILPVRLAESSDGEDGVRYRA